MKVVDRNEITVVVAIPAQDEVDAVHVIPQSPAYSRYVAAKCMPTPDGKYGGEALGEMQRAILQALRSGEPLPEEMRSDLAFAFEYLCAGVKAELLTPVGRPGGREIPIAKHLKAVAVRYLRLVDDGHIDDYRPTATVAEAFDVSDRAVRGWKTALSDLPSPRADFDVDAKSETGYMKAAGKRYRRLVGKPTSNPHSQRGRCTR